MGWKSLKIKVDKTANTDLINRMTPGNSVEPSQDETEILLEAKLAAKTGRRRQKDGSKTKTSNAHPLIPVEQALYKATQRSSARNWTRKRVEEGNFTIWRRKSYQPEA